MSETTNYGGVDLTRHPALKEAYRIACLIEACGASPELTAASIAAFDFIRTLDAALPPTSDTGFSYEDHLESTHE